MVVQINGKTRDVLSIEKDLTEIEVTQPKNKKMTVDLGGGVGIKMKYPKADIMEKLVYDTEEVDKIFSILIHCIDYILHFLHTASFSFSFPFL